MGGGERGVWGPILLTPLLQHHVWGSKALNPTSKYSLVTTARRQADMLLGFWSVCFVHAVSEHSLVYRYSTLHVFCMWYAYVHVVCMYACMHGCMCNVVLYSPLQNIFRLFVICVSHLLKYHIIRKFCIALVS